MTEVLSDSDEAVPLEIVSGGDEAVLFPARNPALVTLPTIEGKPLRFASGGAVAPRAVPVREPRARARRRPRLDPFDLAVLVLIVGCAAACVYRIFWAMQP